MTIENEKGEKETAGSMLSLHLNSGPVHPTRSFCREKIMQGFFRHSMIVCLISLPRSDEHHTLSTLDSEVHPGSMNYHSPRPLAVYSRMR
jgi:hypothetical protein